MEAAEAARGEVVFVWSMSESAKSSRSRRRRSLACSALAAESTRVVVDVVVVLVPEAVSASHAMPVRRMPRKMAIPARMRFLCLVRDRWQAEMVV